MTSGVRTDIEACSVSECTHSGRFVRGMCLMHYGRWRKHGDPLAGDTFRGDPARYLREVVLPFNSDECLIWPFARSGDGYGQIYQNGKVVYVHRLACEERHGSPPPDMPQALHSCGRGVDGCVNPVHLDWGNQSANEADKVRHGTSNRREHRQRKAA